MTNRRAVREPASVTRMWQILDGEADPADQDSPRKLSALVDATWDLWRRLDDPDLPRTNVLRGQRRKAARAGAPADLLGFIDEVCEFVEQTEPVAATERDDRWASAGVFSWAHDVSAARTPDLDRLAAACDASWKLYTSACLLGLDNWRREIADVVLRRSRDVFVPAGHLGRWRVAAKYRGYHHVVFMAVQRLASDEDPVFEQHFMLHNPNPIPDVIGGYLGKEHVRQQELLGSLSKNAVALDIGMHIRGSEYDSNQFVGGYEHCVDDEIRAVVSRIGPQDVQAITVPREHFGIGVPALYYRSYQQDSPAVDFSVCTWLLPQDEDYRRDLGERWERLTGQDVVADAVTAAELAGEAADIDPEIDAKARAFFVRTMENLVAAGRFGDVIRVVDATEPWLASILDDSEHGWLRAYYQVARTTTVPRDEAPWLISDACAALATSDRPQDLTQCESLLRTVLTDQTYANQHDQLIGSLIRCKIRQTTVEMNVRPAAELSVLLDELDISTDLVHAARIGIVALVGPAVGGRVVCGCRRGR
ncbi:hypothetical protein DMH04_08700 [Kibdelosporangium aridum]|uniref:Uncharacterized protein n=1 Tax=Kibdelosporangium aridum TaxID=2030 RepID=A0A428ZKR7_KIBAR|nr:hypothetical protein [Kibdelosporangium aridum]RSM88689.1 hypothetical protein DMH04_08700 [Kibdelosporangium aridum]